MQVAVGVALGPGELFSELYHACRRVTAGRRALGNLPVPHDLNQAAGASPEDQLERSDDSGGLWCFP